MINHEYAKHHFGRRAKPTTWKSKQAWISHNYMRHLPANKNAALLEIGPGMGECLQLLSGELGYRNYDAIDVSEDVVALCNRIVPGSTQHVTDTVAFLRDNKGRYDLVLMLHVLEHVMTGEVIPMLEAARGALRTGGRVIVEVPNCANPLTGSYYRYVDLTHQSGFTEFSLGQALSMAGFQAIKISDVKVPKDSFGRWGQAALQACIGGLLRALLKVYLPRERISMAPAIYTVAG